MQESELHKLQPVENLLVLLNLTKILFVLSQSHSLPKKCFSFSHAQLGPVTVYAGLGKHTEQDFIFP